MVGQGGKTNDTEPGQGDVCALDSCAIERSACEPAEASAGAPLSNISLKFPPYLVGGKEGHVIKRAQEKRWGCLARPAINLEFLINTLFNLK